MNASKTLSLPDKITGNREELSGPQNLFNDLIEWVSTFDSGWSPQYKESANKVINCLRNALWYVDSSYEKFKENGCPIPMQFHKFSGYNNFRKHHHWQPIITQEKLNEHCIQMSNCLSLPCMSTNNHKTLSGHMESLLECFLKYKERLYKDNTQHKLLHHERSEPTFEPHSDSSCQFVSATTKVESKYLSLNEAVSSSENYEFVNVDNFCSTDRFERRKCIKNLRLSKPVMLYRVSFGGSVGTLNFVWKVLDEDSPE